MKIESEIDIRIPETFEVGIQEIGVFVDGGPAKGQVELTDPAGNLFVRKLNDDGTTSFLFDEPGEWKIKFETKTKQVTALKKKKQTPSAIAIMPEEQPPSAATGFFAVSGSPELVVVVLILLALTVAAYKYFYAVVVVSKVFANGKVKLKVTNRQGGLQNLVLMDVAPEGKASAFSQEPEAKETISGTVLKWRKPALAKGETWIVEYELDAEEATELKHAELRAEKNGKNITITS